MSDRRPSDECVYPPVKTYHAECLPCVDHLLKKIMLLQVYVNLPLWSHGCWEASTGFAVLGDWEDLRSMAERDPVKDLEEKAKVSAVWVRWLLLLIVFFVFLNRLRASGGLARKKNIL